jgi:hypothetical protein
MFTATDVSLAIEANVAERILNHPRGRQAIKSHDPSWLIHSFFQPEQTSLNSP